jgi:repressor of nif and glnA expression
MAKFEEPFEETQDLYTQLIDKAGLSNYINITILANNKAKEIFKVNKANELHRYRTGDDIIIVINEKIFDQLTPDQRVIVVEESLASIHYNMEKDKIEITKPDVVTFSGILSKHGFDTWNVLQESVKTLYNAEQEA